MTRDDVLRLARQAWTETGEGWTAEAWFRDRAESFERFATLVAAAEREKRDELLAENAAIKRDIKDAVADEIAVGHSHLLEQIEDLKKQRNALLAVLNEAVGAVVYLSEKARIHQAEWAAWNTKALATIAMAKVDHIPGATKMIDQCDECKSLAKITAAECARCNAAAPAFTEAANILMEGGAA